MESDKPVHHRLRTKIKHAVLWPCKKLAHFWRKNWWHKLIVVLATLFVVSMGTMYGIARWYINSTKDQPLTLGTSFIPAYAESLGLDPKATMDALIKDLGVRHFRLVSYWNQLQPAQGQYDFTVLDWQFQKAEAAGAKVTLSLGLRQPRWPECHQPEWVGKTLPPEQMQMVLEQFLIAVVNRYKGSPSLESYQLENEYFLKGFSQQCTDFSRQRLVDEYNLVKETDPYHPIIVSRSNNALGMPIGQPKPDEFGISIYKRVWDGALTHRYLEYPFPAWYYGFVAGAQKMLTGRDMIIHELQAEAYGPNQKSLPDISLDEQNKSFNAQRFTDRIEFGKATGMREIYLWGSEYWYYRMVKLNDPSLWNVAQKAFKDAR